MKKTGLASFFLLLVIAVGSLVLLDRGVAEISSFDITKPVQTSKRDEGGFLDKLSSGRKIVIGALGFGAIICVAYMIIRRD